MEPGQSREIHQSPRLIPGHAYLAVPTDPFNASHYFIETTMIGQENFDTAVHYGKSAWEKDSPKIETDPENYGWVNIPHAREQGILPLPWR